MLLFNISSIISNETSTYQRDGLLSPSGYWWLLMAKSTWKPVFNCTVHGWPGTQERGSWQADIPPHTAGSWGTHLGVLPCTSSCLPMTGVLWSDPGMSQLAVPGLNAQSLSCCEFNKSSWTRGSHSCYPVGTQKTCTERTQRRTEQHMAASGDVHPRPADASREKNAMVSRHGFQRKLNNMVNSVRLY